MAQGGDQKFGSISGTAREKAGEGEGEDTKKEVGQEFRENSRRPPRVFSCTWEGELGTGFGVLQGSYSRTWEGELGTGFGVFKPDLGLGRF